MEAPERIWAVPSLGGDWTDFAGMWWPEDTGIEPQAEYVRADLAQAPAPDWLTNCAACGRIVDTREKAEGGDGHGCEYPNGWTCSSDCAEKLHPDPDWMREGLAAQAPAPVRVKALQWSGQYYPIASPEPYQIWSDNGGSGAPDDPREAFDGFMLYSPHMMVLGLHPTLEAAQIAAQADYEQRVLAAIARRLAPGGDLKLIADCELAAKVMADAGTFETGQSILREAAARISALTATVGDHAAKALLAEQGEQSAWQDLQAERAEAATLRDRLARMEGALRTAEAALADIGDAEHEPEDDLAWCERRAADALPWVRAALTDGGSNG